MRHLSRFLIGIRHKAAFRVRTYAGVLIDNILELYPDLFEGGGLEQDLDKFRLTPKTGHLYVHVTKDDLIVDSVKSYDTLTREYREINEREILDLASDVTKEATEILSLKELSRIGIIYEFRVPKRELNVENLAGFIREKFVNFPVEAEAGEAGIRFSYKTPLAEGGRGNNKNFKNCIIQVSESKGIDDDGVWKDCLLASVDIQRIFDPGERRIDIDEHYQYSKDHLALVLSKFREKGLTINL